MMTLSLTRNQQQCLPTYVRCAAEETDHAAEQQALTKPHNFKNVAGEGAGYSIASAAGDGVVWAAGERGGVFPGRAGACGGGQRAREQGGFCARDASAR